MSRRNQNHSLQRDYEADDAQDYELISKLGGGHRVRVPSVAVAVDEDVMMASDFEPAHTLTTFTVFQDDLSADFDAGLTLPVFTSAIVKNSELRRCIITTNAWYAQSILEGSLLVVPPACTNDAFAHPSSARATYLRDTQHPEVALIRRVKRSVNSYPVVGKGVDRSLSSQTLMGLVAGVGDSGTTFDVEQALGVSLTNVTLVLDFGGASAELAITADLLDDLRIKPEDQLAMFGRFKQAWMGVRAVLCSNQKANSVVAEEFASLSHPGMEDVRNLNTYLDQSDRPLRLSILFSTRAKDEHHFEELKLEFNRKVQDITQEFERGHGANAISAYDIPVAHDACLSTAVRALPRPPQPDAGQLTAKANAKITELEQMIGKRQNNPIYAFFYSLCLRNRTPTALPTAPHLAYMAAIRDGVRNSDAAVSKILSLYADALFPFAASVQGTGAARQQRATSELASAAQQVQRALDHGWATLPQWEIKLATLKLMMSEEVRMATLQRLREVRHSSHVQRSGHSAVVRVEVPPTLVSVISMVKSRAQEPVASEDLVHVNPVAPPTELRDCTMLGETAEGIDTCMNLYKGQGGLLPATEEHCWFAEAVRAQMTTVLNGK